MSEGGGIVATDATAAALRARLGDLGARLAEIEGERSLPVDDDSAERATEREGAEVLDAIDEAIVSEISDITHALARISGGSYGLCADCGEPIAGARLNALPTAMRCIACQKGKP